MILAAGLTPAWQQILRFSQVRPGEVNRAVEAVWCASGKVLNVGMALAELSAAAHTVAPVGGWSGQAIKDEFKSRGLAASWIPAKTTTRVCTTVLDEANGTTTELVANALPLTDAELAAGLYVYRQALKDARMVVFSGSLPQGTPAHLFRDWLRATPCPVVLDQCGPELLACLELKPRVVKPNRQELAATLNATLGDTSSIVAAMKELTGRGAQASVVTQGKGAVLVVEGDKAWELTPPTVTPVVNPIGSGDCLAAGIAAGLAQGETLIEAVRLGMAAAAENVATLLPARLDRQRVAARRAEVVVREI